ncbi:MAG: glucosaminidase domain-containing protein [Rikenellaceae bacterium]
MIISRKSIFSTLLLLITAQIALAQGSMTRQEYINKYKYIAVDHMSRYDIPASITMAQGILESSFGNSDLSRRSNNHFGIKCKTTWTGEKVYHDDDEKGECFRAYPTVEASYADHAQFLKNSQRYATLFTYDTDDYKSWARGLKKAGYATANDYPERLISIIEDNDLAILDQKDGMAKYAALHGGSAVAPTLASGSATGWFDDASSNHVQITTGGVELAADSPLVVNAKRGYTLYSNNNVHYVIAGQDDTFESIGEFFDVTPRKIRKFNDLPRRAKLVAGEVVYVAPKGDKGLKSSPSHVVQAGETIHSVAQSYGITVKALRRFNKHEVKYVLNHGQTIMLIK